MRNGPFTMSPDSLHGKIRKMYTPGVLITLTEARRRLGRVITHARISGESVTITDRDEPVAVLVPVIPPQAAAPGETAGVPATASQAPLPASSATEG
jgi:prevent-host-death family protein